MASERDAVVSGVLVPMPTKRPLSNNDELPRVVPSVVNLEMKLSVPDKAPESEPQENLPVSDHRSFEVAAVSQSDKPAPLKWRDTTRLVVDAPAPQSPSVLAPNVEVAFGACREVPTFKTVRMVADAFTSRVLPAKRF